MGTLYLVATPIGNLEDVTFRALRVLREVSLVAAEDTRVTRKLLARHKITVPLISFYEHNKLARLPQVMDVLASGDVALVTDAGTPGVSDPGADLVAAAAEAGFPVVPVPGPSSVTAALSVAGFPTAQFTFLGFLPRTRTERVALLASLAREPRVLVCFEAPHRLLDTLADALESLGDRPVVVCRELTKVHEEVWRGTVSEALRRFSEPRGEFTLVFAPAVAAEDLPVRDEVWARSELERMRAQGVRPRDAVSLVAKASGLPQREVYRIWASHAPGDSQALRGIP